MARARARGFCQALLTASLTLPLSHSSSPFRCYVKRNPEQGYVRAVSLPKLRKVQAKFANLMK